MKAEKLTFPYGEPLVRGRIKIQAEDFRVSENLGFEASGEGEHLLLQIEKTNFTTQQLIECLARDYSVKARDIGYCGLKDKIAITRQWISLPLVGKKPAQEIPESSEYNILSQAWHHRKLRPGSHASNHFDVLVRDVESLPTTSWRQIDSICAQGMANYFGRQRFGSRNDNVEQALRVFGNPRRTRKLSRNKRSIYLSALRSFLFNSILSRRIALGFWRAPMPGDLFMLGGSQSVFYEAISDRLMQRYAQLDISSSISLYGKGKRMLQGDALALEDRVLADYESIEQCLIRQDAGLQMRTARIAVPDLAVEHDADMATLRIQVSLPPGSYFTSLLDHFVDTAEVAPSGTTDGGATASLANL